MDTIKLDERFHEIQRYLEDHQSNPEAPYWFMPGYCLMHEGSDFCLDCIQFQLPGAECGEEYDGGFSCESDGSVICDRCGKLLAYTLTDYGVVEELAHFAEFSPHDLTNADTCYALARIGGGLFGDEQKAAFVALFDGITLPAVPDSEAHDEPR